MIHSAGAKEIVDRRSRPDRERARLILFSFIIALSGVVVFWNSTRNSFVLDDLQIVVRNPYVKEPAKIKEIFRVHYWAPEQASNLYRPLTILSLALNHRAARLDPFGYHLVNIVLHAGVSVLVFFLALRVLSSLEAAFAAGVLFSLHPVHVEAVAPAVGRSECLAAALSILALVLYLRARRARSFWALGAVSVIAYFLATLSKESAFALPALLVIWEVLHPGAPKRKALMRVLPFVLAAAASWVVRGVALDWAVRASVPFIDNPAAKLGLLPRLLTAVMVTGRYLLLLVFPRHLSADYSYAEIPPVTTLTDAGLLAGGAALVVVCLAAVLLRRRVPELLFAVCFFAVFYAPVSNSFIPSGTIMAERLIYLPSVGFCLAGGALAGRLYRSGNRRVRIAAFVVFIAVAAGYGLRTLSRNRDFRTNETLFKKTVQTSPRSAKMRLYYGDLLSSLGRFEEADSQLAAAERILPDYGLTHGILGAHLGRKGQHAEAARHLQEAVRLNPDYAEGRRNLGNAYRMLGKFSNSVRELTLAVNLTPQYPDLWCDLGVSHLMNGNSEEAKRSFNKALTLNPSQVDAIYGLGRAWEAEREFRQAEQMYRRCLKINPLSGDAHVRLAAVLEAQGKDREALEAYDAALALHPSDLDLRSQKARLLTSLNRHMEAIEALQEAARLNPSSPQPWNNIGRVYSMKGDMSRAREAWKKALSIDAGNAFARRCLMETGGLE